MNRCGLLFSKSFKSSVHKLCSNFTLNCHQAHQPVTFQDQPPPSFGKKISSPFFTGTLLPVSSILHKEPIIAFPSAFSILSHNLSLESGLFLSIVTLFYYLPTSQLCLNYQCYSPSSLTPVPPWRNRIKDLRLYRVPPAFVVVLIPRTVFFKKTFFSILILFRI